MIVSLRHSDPTPRAPVASPLAPAGSVTLLQRIAVADLAEAWLGNLGIDIVPLLPAITEIELYACDRTGLQFFAPAAAAGSAALYERLEEFPWYYIPDKWEHAVALDHCAGARRVLEVGCAEGSFLDACRARGIEATGVELNPRAAAIARRRGHTVWMGSLGDLHAGQSEAWDAVCGFQVLEHVADAGRFFDDLLSLVRPGGRLALAVPNRDSFIRHVHADHGVPLDTPPHHMSRWNADVFRRLARLREVVVESIAYEPLAAEHGTYWLDIQCRRWQRGRLPGKRLARSPRLQRLASRMLGLGLRRLIRGQTMLVILRKP